LSDGKGYLGGTNLGRNSLYMFISSFNTIVPSIMLKLNSQNVGYFNIITRLKYW